MSVHTLALHILMHIQVFTLLLNTCWCTYKCSHSCFTHAGAHTSVHTPTLHVLVHIQVFTLLFCTCWCTYKRSYSCSTHALYTHTIPTALNCSVDVRIQGNRIYTGVDTPYMLRHVYTVMHDRQPK